MGKIRRIHCIPCKCYAQGIVEPDSEVFHVRRLKGTAYNLMSALHQFPWANYSRIARIAGLYAITPSLFHRGAIGGSHRQGDGFAQHP